MAKTVHIKKGFQPRLTGGIAPTVSRLKNPRHVAACPATIPFIKPRLKVKKGDKVDIGSLLFEDKKEPRFRFLSPGGGHIEDIQFGPRRIIDQIVIKRSPEEENVTFPTLGKAALNIIDRKDLITMLTGGGVWPMIRSLPFRDIADPDAVPPAIFVTLDDSEPFLPHADCYLNNNMDLFSYGINVLKRLADKVYIAAARNGRPRKMSDDPANLYFTGNYPAGDAGVLLYHTKTTSDQNHSWYIDGQDVLMLARLLTEGRYPVKRMVAVGGSEAVKRQHFHTRLGVPVRALIPDFDKFETIRPTIRLVAGGVFRGRKVSAAGYLGLYETALTLLPEGNEKEFMALFNPGWRKVTYSRAFLSPLNRSPISQNCNRHGDERACIACMHCADVCPVDILPQLTYKAVLAAEVEEALEHGLLDCVACGLCTYVCPSKIELADSLANAKAAYRKERASQ